MQQLQDKMHNDAKWDDVNILQKPLELYALIERVIMKQTGNEYAPCKLVDHLLVVLTMRQSNNMSNSQWYEKFNTQVDVAKSIGVMFDQFNSLWEYCCMAKGWGTHISLSANEQDEIRLNPRKDSLPT